MKDPDILRLARLVLQRGEISRTELARETGLAPSHVGSRVQELLQRDVLIQSGLAPSHGGRRRILLRINPEFAHLVAVDIGTANVRIAVTDFLGEVLRYETLPPGVEAVPGDLIEHLAGRVAALSAADPRIAGIGIAHSGVVDAARGTVLFWPKVPAWKDTELAADLAARTGFPVSLQDSVRAMALAEQRFGLGQGLRNFIYVTVGMGIGSAIFVNGEMYGGAFGLAGELGHTTVDEQGDLCPCGNRGCLEILSSGSAVIQRVRQALTQGAASTLSERLSGQEELSVEAIVAAARAHDRLAERVLYEAGGHFGTALASIVNLLNPEKVILGGAVPSLAGDLFLEPALRRLSQRAMRPSLRGLDVEVSTVGERAAILGAVFGVSGQVLAPRLLAQEPVTAS